MAKEERRAAEREFKLSSVTAALIHHLYQEVCVSQKIMIRFFSSCSVKLWASAFGGEIKSISAKYSGSQLLQKVLTSCFWGLCDAQQHSELHTWSSCAYFITMKAVKSGIPSAKVLRGLRCVFQRQGCVWACVRVHACVCVCVQSTWSINHSSDSSPISSLQLSL